MNRSTIDLWVGIFVVIGIGAIVFLALKVGNLTSLQTAQTYRAVVTMSVDQGYPFSKDTIASILTSGLLGEVYIGLDAGGDTQMLADGGVITKTQSAVVLEKLIGQFLFDKASTLGGGK